jgi:hypothetical protein
VPEVGLGEISINLPKSVSGQLPIADKPGVGSAIRSLPMMLSSPASQCMKALY